MRDALLAAISTVTAIRPLPGPLLGRYAVPIFEVRSGQSADAAAAVVSAGWSWLTNRRA